MFAPSQNPLTQTNHLHRTYQTHHTTSKKNLNKENSHAPLPSKTPSRQVLNGKPLLNTGLRTGLGVKTAPRDGNVVYDSGGLDKGKGKMGDDIGPKRLFASTSKPTSSKTTLPPSKSLSQMPYIHQTPAPNRQTSQNLKTPAPVPAPAPTPLPSATRTRRRSKQSLSHTPIRNSESTQSFVTPQPSGVRWEEGDSLGSVEMGGAISLEGVEEEMNEDSEGEIEYMPPRAIELPWEPAHKHPDLSEIFKGFTDIRTYDIPREAQVEMDDLTFEEETIVRVNLCPDDELEEPIFRTKTVPPPQPATVTSKPKSIPSARSATIRPAQPPLPNSRPRVVSRAGLPIPDTTAIGRKSSALPTSRTGMRIPPVKIPAPPVSRTVARVPFGPTRVPQSTQFVAGKAKPVAIPRSLLEVPDIEMPLQECSLDFE